MRENWAAVEYKSLVDKISTVSQKIKQQEYSPEGKIAVVDQGQDLIGGYTDDESKKLDCELPVIVFGDHTKSVKLINFPFAPGADGTKVLQPKQCIVPKYLSYLTNVLVFKIEDKGYARHYQHIEKQDFPLAPLPEQRAIVAKIEQLFSELDNGIANLKTAKTKLETYRQAVLKKAFEGELTNKKEISFRPISDFAELVTKGASPKWQGFDYLDNKDELLFVTSENVRAGYLDFSKEKYLPLKFNEKQKRSVLQKGDVLFNLVGASIGRAAIFNLDKIANINQAVSVIRLNKEISNVYLNYFLNSEVAKQDYLQKKVEVARANLSLKDVNDIPIPYCSLEGQHEIIHEIETRLSVCDNIQHNIEEGLAKAEALRQSILKKAFEGKLLNEAELAACRKEPDWEPAEKLLERIKREHSQNAPTKEH